MGFKPSFFLVKRITDGAESWVMFDNKRSTSGKNVIDKRLNPNSAGAEQSGDIIDFLSNGFKLKATPNYVNGSGDTYIFMAFAENPFVTGASAIPATAR